MKMNNKFLKKINSPALIIIVIGILIMVNFFSYNIFYRFDITENRDYSISQASKKAVASLKDIVNIKVYFSSNLPSQYLNLRQEVSDILDEYVSFAGGQVRVEFIDPGDDETTKQDLYMAGIPELQFNVLEKDKYQVVNGYLGLAVKYGEKSQVLPVVDSTHDFEYQITSAIKKITSDRLAKIGFWQGNGASPETANSAIISRLNEVYDVAIVNFAADKKIPNNLDTLIIIGPRENFSDEELKAIDDFLIGGGSLVVLADGVTVSQGLEAKANDTGLNKILAGYGAKLNNDLILDVNNGMASFSQGFVTFSTNYPYWPKVVKSGFDQNNIAVARLEGLVLPWASSISLDAQKTKDLKISILASSSERAMAVADNFQLSPQAEIANGPREKFNLAVSLAGEFTSAFSQSNGSGRLILVGDSDFISDNFLRNYPDNLVFLQNVVDSFSLGDDLIAIRSKGITERPLKEISEPVKAAIRYVNIFGLTVIVILFGLARYFLRRRVKMEDEI